MLDLDDSETRRLLHLAADTIDVAPAGPLSVPSHRPRWPGLVAAATVAVVATGLAVGLRGDEPPVPAPAPSPPVVDQLPARPPSVFGYDTYDAVQMLEALGYEVSTELVPSCDTYGRAVGTTPGPGPGQVTVLRGNGGDTAFCARSPEDPARADAWELLDLVGGRDSRLDLAPTVRVYDATTGQRGAAIAASRLATWPTIVEALSVPAGSDASLSTRRTVDGSCGPRPRALRGRSGLQVSVESRDASPNCRTVTLFQEGGEVVAVQVVLALVGG